jgi:hypothetical protein
MRSRPEDSVWPATAHTNRTASPQPRSLANLTDEWLLMERGRRRAVVDQLARHPGTSPAVGPLLERADSDIERITAELIGRVVARGAWSSDPLPHSRLA